MRVIILLLLAMLLATAARSQTSSCFPHCHRCEVGIVDRAATRILTTAHFSPLTGEEELTNKTFRVPGTNLTVLASVFYTDESMASKAGRDSMQLALAVSTRSWPSAFEAPDNAVAEITLATFDTARIETNVRSGSKKLFVCMQCKDVTPKRQE